MLRAVCGERAGEIQIQKRQKDDADLPRLMRILRGANYGLRRPGIRSAEDPWQAVPIVEEAEIDGGSGWVCGGDFNDPPLRKKFRPPGL
jgi:hypothetical protein